MKTLILIYDSFAEFEVSLVGLFMKGKGEVHMISPNNTLEYVTGEGRFQTVPHVTISEVQVSDYDLLVIPGGNPIPLLANETLLQLIQAFSARGKVLAGICAGPILLSAAGVLSEKKYTTSYSPEVLEAKDHFIWDRWTNEDVTLDGNIITAKGNAYVEFAIAIYKALGLFEGEQDELETHAYFKNQMKVAN